MKSELFYLKVSFWVNLFIVAAALTLVVTARSLTVLFAGMYALIACLMTAVSIRMISLLDRSNDAKYSFHYNSYEPLVVAVRGLIVLSVALNTLFSSLKAVMSGGRLPEFSLVAAYGAFAMAVSFAMAFFAAKMAKQTGSKFFLTERRNWRIGGVLSFVVFVAFTGGYFTQGTVRYYFDPIVAIAMVLSVLPIPIKIIYHSFRQQLFVTPLPEVQETIRTRYRALPQDGKISQAALRVTQVGRVVYAHVTAAMAAETSVTIDELDAIRDRIEKAIVANDQHTFCDVLFTARPDYPGDLIDF